MDANASKMFRGGNRPATPVSSEVEEWLQQWRDENTGFQMDTVHPFLEKYFMSHLLNNVPAPLVFMPLCGQSVDMLWLAERNCKVIGVEIAENPVKEFFDTHKLDYTCDQVQNYTVFTTKDGKITVYCGDFFDILSVLPSGIKFDIVWDRGAYVSVYQEDRKRYGKVIREVMKKSTRLLVATMCYDDKIYAGPPFCVHEAELRNLYDPEKFKCQLMEKMDVLNEARRDNWHLQELTEDCYFVNGKI